MVTTRPPKTIVKPTALGPVANTDTKLLIYGLFRKGRVLAQDDVEVIDNGYRFDGKTYPSLTAITKRITGTHWSGPRFFGLTPKRKA